MRLFQPAIRFALRRPPPRSPDAAITLSFADFFEHIGVEGRMMAVTLRHGVLVALITKRLSSACSRFDGRPIGAG